MVSWTFSELNSRILFFFDQLQRKGCALEWPESAKKVEKVIQKIFDSDFISTPSEAFNVLSFFEPENIFLLPPFLVLAYILIGLVSPCQVSHKQVISRQLPFIS